MAGGSQIIINDHGITIKTGGKIVYQAGQHKFESGTKIKTVFPSLPVMIDQPYSAAVTFLVSWQKNARKRRWKSRYLALFITYFRKFISHFQTDNYLFRID